MAHDHSLDNFDNEFVAGFLSGQCGEITTSAVRRLLIGYPDIAARFQPVPHLKWRESLSSRLADLAACVAAGSPKLFAAQIAWSRAAFSVRGVPISDLERSLRVLHEVIMETLPREDGAIVDTYFRAAFDALDEARPDESVSISPGTPEGELAAKFLLAVLEGDRLRASDVILTAAREGMPVRAIYDRVLIPVQRELGRLWHSCEINVAEEHFATATTCMVMAQLQPLAPRKPRDGRCLLAASVEGDLHDVGVRMLCDVFEMEGWRVICLGASVPASDIAAAAAFFHADLVALGAALPGHLDRVRECVQLLKQSPAAPPVILGGNVFAMAPELWRSMGADGFGGSVAEALAVAQTLVPVARRHGIA